MKIAIGCDPNAVQMKQAIIGLLEENKYEYCDFGRDDPIYANTALKVAEAVASKAFDRGILLCGTGIGMALTANKVPGAYAVVCSDSYSIERSVLSNNANILTLGAQTHGLELAKKEVSHWLGLQYVAGGRSQNKIDRIYAIEKSFLK